MSHELTLPLGSNGTLAGTSMANIIIALAIARAIRRTSIDNGTVSVLWYSIHAHNIILSYAVSPKLDYYYCPVEWS